ncbi:MAG: hypothetical protein GOU98_05100 [Candidatus Altiarchaeota archaeon]|nr:hypothetical protein [Candidatus Altiarchaeota archaeon]
MEGSRDVRFTNYALDPWVLKKTEKFLEFVPFDNLDDATQRLPDFIFHYKQEERNAPEILSPENENYLHPFFTADYMVKRFEEGNFEPPALSCQYYSVLLTSIGHLKGNRCVVVGCNPDYLEGAKHVLVYDTVTDKFKDPSAYGKYYDGESWVKTPDGFMIDIPKKQLNLRPWSEKLIETLRNLETEAY